MNRIAVAELTSEVFVPFGEVGAPLADDSHTAGDVDGEPWLKAVAPASVVQPGLADIWAFCILPDRFIKLGPGTSHADPYFTEPVRHFYKLEMVDTNTADHTVWRLDQPGTFAT